MAFTHGKAYDDLKMLLNTHYNFIAIWFISSFYFFMNFIQLIGFGSIINDLFKLTLIPFIAIIVLGYPFAKGTIKWIGSAIKDMRENNLSWKSIGGNSHIQLFSTFILVAFLSVVVFFFTFSAITTLGFATHIFENNLWKDFMEAFSPTTRMLISFLTSFVIIPMFYVKQLRKIFHTTGAVEISMLEEVLSGLFLLSMNIFRSVIQITALIVKTFEKKQTEWCRAMINDTIWLRGNSLQTLLKERIGTTYPLRFGGYPSSFRKIFGSEYSFVTLLYWNSKPFVIMSALGETYIHGDTENDADNLRKKICDIIRSKGGRVI